MLCETVFADFEPITLEDKGLLDHYFRKYIIGISELTFTNIFMWKEYYQFKKTEYKETLLLISLKNQDEIVALPPIGENPREAVEYLKSLCKENNMTLCIQRIPPSYAKQILSPDNLPQLETDRDSWDYIYKVEDLANVAGGKYAEIRKKINKFKRENDWEYRAIDSEMVKRLLDIQEMWCFYPTCSEDVTLEYENYGISEILRNWEKLDIYGGVIIVGDRIVAYTIAEQISQDTIIEHVEKACSKMMGAYQTIASELCKHIPEGVVFVNREQDLGLPGLRDAKERLRPISYGEKCKIKFEF